MQINEIIDSRTMFNESWLVEFPEPITDADYAKSLIHDITDYKQHGGQVIKLGNNLFKIEGPQVVYYWYEDQSNNIILGCELEKKAQTLVINLVAKIKKRQPPYASDLYDAILKDRKNIAGENSSILLSSDNKLTMSGFDIWKRLLELGHKIIAYNSSVPGASAIVISNPIELERYFNQNNKQWRYAIVEGSCVGDVKSLFNLRKHREVNNLL